MSFPFTTTEYPSTAAEEARNLRQEAERQLVRAFEIKRTEFLNLIPPRMVTGHQADAYRQARLRMEEALMWATKGVLEK